MGTRQFDQGLFYQQWRTSKAFCVLDDPCIVICARISYTHECHDWIQWYVLALPRPQRPPQPKATNYGSAPATSQPYIQTPDGSQVHWSSFRLVNYVIHDGWRVGLTGDYIVKAVSRDELGMVASILYIHCLVPSICSMTLTDFQADPSNYWDSNICINPEIEYYTSIPLPAYQELTKKCLLTLGVTQCKLYPCRFRTTICTIQLIQASFLKAVGLSKDSSSSVAAQCCHC